MKKEDQTKVFDEESLKRFWSRVDIKSVNECWNWIGNNRCGRDPVRYGRLTIDGEQIVAHRVSYLIKNKIIPANLVVRHKCDNSLCVNPDHLETGTIAENNKDILTRNRHYFKNATKCKKGHPYDLENTIRNKNGSRSCRECCKVFYREYKIRKKLKNEFLKSRGEG